MKKFILASLILASSQVAMAANWVNSYASSIEDKETTYIDFDSIQGYYFNNYDKTNYYVTAWVKSIFNSDKILVNHGGKYRKRVDLWYIDCINKKATQSDMIFYNNSGKLIFNGSMPVDTYSSSHWNKIVPGSIGEQLAKEICSIYPFKQSHQK